MIRFLFPGSVLVYIALCLVALYFWGPFGILATVTLLLLLA